jgi:hypothetical protein
VELSSQTPTKVDCPEQDLRQARLLKWGQIIRPAHQVGSRFRAFLNHSEKPDGFQIATVPRRLFKQASSHVEPAHANRHKVFPTEFLLPQGNLRPSPALLKIATNKRLMDLHGKPYSPFSGTPEFA